MQPITDLVARYRTRGINLGLDAGRLAVRAPKGALSEADRQELAALREPLLAFLRQEGDHSFPLTEIQTAYWMGRQSSQLGGVGCHAYREFALDGINLDGLEAAWNRLLERHEMLRAVIDADGRQRIQREVPYYRLRREDFGGGAPAQARRKALRDAMSHRVFDPAVWPLFDLRLTCVDARWHLHMGLDLLIADAASILLLYREWRQLYLQPAQVLPPPARRFADFVRNEGPAPRDIEAAARYWQPRLAALPGPPQLPQLRAPAELAETRFVRHATRLSGRDWTALAARAREAGMTPSALLLAAYADVLAAYSRSQHFLLTLTLFRAPPEYAGVVGDFTSTLLVEVDARAASFRQRATQVQAALAVALEHDGWSGVRLARELGRLRGDGSGAVPVVFTSALGHGARGEAEHPLDWLGETVHAITQTPQVWIDHHVIEDGEDLVLSFDRVAGLLPDDLAAAMFAAHERLLRSLAADAAAWELPLGAHLEADDLAERAAANATTLELPLQRLEQGLRRVEPGRRALAGDGFAWTYAELGQRAAGVAQALRAAGVGPGRLVGICLPRSPLQIAAVLGTLLAGAAYVPIASSAPALRRQRLLQRSGIDTVLCQQDALETEWPAACQRLAVEQLAAGELQDLAPPEQDLQALAYVIFTSGSTGEPKGVMIEHGAAANTIADINRRFEVGAQDVLFALSDLGFDLSVYDLFGALAAGACLVLPGAGSERDPQHWSDCLLQHQVTVWNSVPALAAMLVEHAGGPYPDLRLILLSGDWVPVGLPAALRRIAPNARVIALGGATEASIWSNWFDTAELDPAATSVPYGWPLANQRFHVLNEALEPAPRGVAGGLYIAGAGLARGYLGDATLSETKFFEHPRSGERLYATGDMGRYLSGGAIEFLGREDAQVKIDGFRIELGEVEAALRAYPTVREAAAFVVQGASGARRLAAAVVLGAASGTPAEQALDASDGSLSDPAERLAFRLRQIGRHDQATASALALPAAPLQTEARRRSQRRFLATMPSLQSLSELLATMASTPAELGPQYRYPSAGSAYPVQVWLHARWATDGLAAGLYRYLPGHHQLLPAQAEAPFPLQAQAAVNRDVAESAAFALYLVADLDAIEPLYGRAGRDFSLIEAGAMLQLLMQQATALGLGLCPIGRFDSGVLAAALGLDERRQIAISLLGGHPDPNPALPAQSVEALASHLAQRLPAYMLPDRLLLLPQLPLSGNGKVDRKALAEAWARSAPATGEAIDGELESAVAAIFCEVLGCSQPGRKAAIFDLGGTSLHVVRIHRRLQARFGEQLDIVDLFRQPSVAGIAALLGGATGPGGAGQGSARGARRRAALAAKKDGADA